MYNPRDGCFRFTCTTSDSTKIYTQIKGIFMSFIGRTAVITGAGQGIGRQIAITLAQRGASVMICDINKDKAAATADIINQNGGTAKYNVANVSVTGDLKMMVEKTVSDFGGIDILVNNAGILSSSSISETSEEEWDNVMAINLKGSFFALKEVVPYMEKKKYGRIINISSLAGRMGGYANGAAYAASKAGLIGMTMCTARKLAPLGITVNAVAPGTTQTDIISVFSEERINSLKASIPMNMLGQPEDVAETVAFLASDEAKFITGAVIDVNGGMFMG